MRLGPPAWGQAGKQAAGKQAQNIRMRRMQHSLLHAGPLARRACIRHHEAEPKGLGYAAGAVAVSQAQVQLAKNEAQGPARQRRLCEVQSEQGVRWAGQPGALLCLARWHSCAEVSLWQRARHAVELSCHACPPPPVRLKLKARSVRMRVREGLCSSGISCSQGVAAGRARGGGWGVGGGGEARAWDTGPSQRNSGRSGSAGCCCTTPAPTACATRRGPAPTLACSPGLQVGSVKALLHQQPGEVYRARQGGYRGGANTATTCPQARKLGCS